MKTPRPPLLVVALALLVPLAGCIESARDLGDRLRAEDPIVIAADTVTPLDDAPATTNATRPPVARLAVYAENGALVFQSSFIGEDVEAPIFVTENSNLSLNAAESKALTSGATLTAYRWEVAGVAHEGRAVVAQVGAAGVYPVTLTVTDSTGGNDTQSIRLAVAPKPFDVVVERATGPVAGADGHGVNGTATFDVSTLVEDVEHKIQLLTFKTKLDLAEPTRAAPCDAILTIALPDGSRTGSVDQEDATSSEVIKIPNAAGGTYSAVVDGFACASPGGVLVELTITYLAIIPGLEGDGHAHAH